MFKPGRFLCLNTMLFRSTEYFGVGREIFFLVINNISQPKSRNGTKWSEESQERSNESILVLFLYFPASKGTFLRRKVQRKVQRTKLNLAAKKDNFKYYFYFIVPENQCTLLTKLNQRKEQRILPTL